MSIAALRFWECRDKYLQSNANLRKGQNNEFFINNNLYRSLYWKLYYNENNEVFVKCPIRQTS